MNWISGAHHMLTGFCSSFGTTVLWGSDADSFGKTEIKKCCVTYVPTDQQLWNWNVAQVLFGTQTFALFTEHMLFNA